MRNNSIDLAKLIACVFVVCLHVGNFSEIGIAGSSVLNAAGRWAVPFFFIVTGYFIGKKEGLNVVNSIKNIIPVFLFACFFYSFILYFQYGYRFNHIVEMIFSMKTFYSGVFFHLWFLCSMVFGLMIFWYLESSDFIFVKWPCAFLIVFLCAYYDIRNSIGVRVDSFYFFRELISYPMILIGFKIAKSGHVISVKRSAILLIISLALMVGDVFIFDDLYGASALGRQFPIFSCVLAYAILMVCLSKNIKENIYSYLGKKYSLGIYILHPAYGFVFYKIFKGTDLEMASVMAFSVISSTLFTLITMRKITPRIFALLNGR